MYEAMGYKQGTWNFTCGDSNLYLLDTYEVYVPSFQAIGTETSRCGAGYLCASPFPPEALSGIRGPGPPSSMLFRDLAPSLT